MTRFSPVLEQQVRHRIPRALRGRFDPEDILQDVWAAALPRLGKLELRGSSMTRVLLRYFSTALLNRINDLSRRAARGERFEPTRAGGEGLSKQALDATGAVTRALRDESSELLRRTLDEMEPEDREVLILRGIEQRPNAEVARILDRSENTVSHRYSRALAKLRQRLPDSVFGDLEV